MYNMDELEKHVSYLFDNKSKYCNGDYVVLMACLMESFNSLKGIVLDGDSKEALASDGDSDDDSDDDTNIVYDSDGYGYIGDGYIGDGGYIESY